MKPGVLKSRQETGYPLYCSIKCRMESTLKRNTYTCSICDKSIYKSYKSKNKDGKMFCGKSCSAIYNNSLRDIKEEKHPNWVGGNNSYQIIARRRYKEECAICGIKDKYCLNTHHIDSDRDNNIAENLIILCANCHAKVHRTKLISREEISIFQNKSKL